MTEYTYMPQVRRVFSCTVPNANIRQIFLMDGVLQEPESDTGGIVLQKGPDQMGLRLHIYGDHADEPIQIISVRSEDLPQPLEFSNSWELAAGASAQIIVCDHTLNEYLYRTSRFSEITLGQGARLDILFMQNEHQHSRYWLNIKAGLAGDSQLDCHILSLYGGTIQNKV